jgi:hypothetical protein
LSLVAVWFGTVRQLAIPGRIVLEGFGKHDDSAVHITFTVFGDFRLLLRGAGDAMWAGRHADGLHACGACLLRQ